MIMLRYIVIPPLVALVLNLLFGRFWGKRTTATLACGSVFMSFAFSLYNFIYMQKKLTIPAMKRIEDFLFSWISVGNVQIPVEFVFDPLSCVMCLVITGVGFLIHLYSVGYMAHDPGFRRFFIYLNLFIVFMLILVLGDNLALLFVGWEGVGLCSYLLIGFWHTDMKNAVAGKKAFVVNRIGDFGFLLGMLLILATFGTLSVTELQKLVYDDGAGIATVICLLLFVGACGKSAQIPLHVWLPDAMAGPTPVSALIHAATMVTAGVYMIARLHFLYAVSPVASGVVAAVIGLAQNDIKKVLAYSTISQLGYMFLAVGVGAYAFGIFHLTTHAFFKALLFLGSGSVIHAMSGEQDMRKMGGLRSHLPWTFWTFLFGVLAIAGIWPLSGFFSKDEILLSARLSHTAVWSGPVLFGIGLFAALLTAFYMGRLFVMTFMGDCRADEKTKHHIHESQWQMLLPLVVLAILSAIAGFWLHAFEGFTSAVFGEPHEAPHDTKFAVMGQSLAVACAGLIAAIYFYLIRPDLPGRVAAGARWLYDLVANKFYIDELYENIAVRSVYWVGVASHAFDKHVVDRAVNWTGGGMRAGGFLLSFFQTGNVATYAVWFLVGVLILLHAMSPTSLLGAP